MAAHAARRLMRMNDNLSRILGVELLCGARGIEYREPLATSEALQTAIHQLRQSVPILQEDRFLAPELENAASLVSSGALAEATGLGPLLGDKVGG
jgi:histidine ammonia-lyase